MITLAKKPGALTLTALSTVPLIMVLGNSMLIPILPKMKSVLDITQFQTSLVITLFSIPAGLTIPLAGFLADSYGRKKVVIPALIIYGLGGIVAGLAAVFAKNAFTLLLVGRVIQGIGAAGTAPIAMALAGDLYKGKERGKALGTIEAANGMGKVISPILGALIATIAWYATFFVFPVLCIPAAAAVYFLVKEPTKSSKKQSLKEYVQGLKTIFKARASLLLPAFFAGSVILYLLFGVLFYLSDFLEKKIGVGGVKKGLLLAIPVLAMASTSLITGRIIKKQKKLMKLLVVIGSFIVAGSFVALSFFENIYFYFACVIFMGIGSGLTLPCLNTMITSAVTMARRGAITALYGGVRFIGVALGPPIFGALANYGKVVLFLSHGVLAALAGVLAWVFIKPQQIKPVKGGQGASTQSDPASAKAVPEDTTSESETTKSALAPAARWGRWLFETVTLRNTIGPLVLRKPLKEQDREAPDSEEKQKQ